MMGECVKDGIWSGAHDDAKLSGGMKQENDSKYYL